MHAKCQLCRLAYRTINKCIIVGIVLHQRCRLPSFMQTWNTEYISFDAPFFITCCSLFIDTRLINTLRILRREFYGATRSSQGFRFERTPRRTNLLQYKYLAVFASGA